jgi:hypothetical protein
LLDKIPFRVESTRKQKRVKSGYIGNSHVTHIRNIARTYGHFR